MSEIYTLTSASLFGIIFRTLGDKEASEAVLKSVYKRIWSLSKAGETPAGDPLNRLRALAHRYAMDYKVKHKLNHVIATPLPAAALKTYEQLSGDSVSEKEFTLLKLAYLNAMPLSALAKSNKCSEEDMERRIKKILSQIRRVTT